MEAAHINVVSSLHEAGPLAMLEAAVAGVPTVGTAVGHIAEWAPAAALSACLGRARWACAPAIRRLLEDEGLRLQIAVRGVAARQSRTPITPPTDFYKSIVSSPVVRSCELQVRSERDNGSCPNAERTEKIVCTLGG